MSSDPPVQSDAPKGVGKRIAKNTGMLFGGKTVATVLNLLVLAVSARALSLDTLGSLFLLHAYVMTISGIASFKSWQALIKYGAEPVANGEIGRFQNLMRFTIGLDVIAALAATIVSVALFPLVRGPMGLSEDLLVPGMVYAGLSALKLRSTPLGVMRLFDRFDLISLQSLIVPVIRLVGATIGLVTGAGLLWFIIVWFAANAVSYLFMPILGIRELAKRGLLTGLFRRPPTLRQPQKGLWRFVWISNLDATIGLVDTHVATLLSGGLLGAGFAATFKIARDISDVLAKSAQLLDKAMYPELVRMTLAGETGRVSRLIVRSSAIMLLIGVVAGALVYFAGPGFFASVLDSEYAGIAPIATALMIAAALYAATAPLYPALYALGEPGRATLARAVSVIAIVLLFFVLVELFGEQGPGWAMIGGQFIGLVLAAWMTVSRLSAYRAEAGQASASASRNEPTSSESAEPDDRTG